MLAWPDPRLLIIYKHSGRRGHRELFNLAYVLLHEKMLAGVDFRGQISELAEKYHTPDWKRVRKQMTKHKGPKNECLGKAFADLKDMLEKAGLRLDK